MNLHRGCIPRPPTTCGHGVARPARRPYSCVTRIGISWTVFGVRGVISSTVFGVRGERVLVSRGGPVPDPVVAPCPSCPAPPRDVTSCRRFGFSLDSFTLTFTITCMRCHGRSSHRPLIPSQPTAEANLLSIEKRDPNAVATFAVRPYLTQCIYQLV